jgi:AcrR family transcriptional regulator
MSTKSDAATAGATTSVDRRQEIVDAAARIFHDKGYAGTSIQDVADAVDILKGSLYYYIRTKEDLLFAVIQEVHEAGLANLERNKLEGGSALDRIRAFVVSHMSYNAENLTKMTVFFHDFRSLGPKRRETIVEERDIYDRYLRKLIKQGKKEGSIRKDVNAKLAAFSILGSMNWMYQWYRPDGPLPISKIAAEFAELAVQSLRNPDSTED